MVDDSHAVGFVGPTGRGTPELFGVRDRVDIVTGTLGAIGYDGPISVEWEDAGMDRLVGAAEAVGFVRRLAFDRPDAAFDAAFSSGE